MGDKADLGRKGASKRRRGQKPKEGKAWFLQQASDVDSTLEDGSSGEEESGSDDEVDQADNSPSYSSAQTGSLLSRLEGLMEGEVTSLAWVADSLKRKPLTKQTTPTRTQRMFLMSLLKSLSKHPLPCLR